LTSERRPMWAGTLNLELIHGVLFATG